VADYTWGKEVCTTQVFQLAAPTNAVELTKMIACAYRQFATAHGREPYDNEIEVTVTDDAIVARFELERKWPAS
jgi:hypothetical protein